MVWFPIVRFELETRGGQFRPLALQIDSGAVVSLLRRSSADLLGVSLESGKRIELTSVGDARTGAYVHSVRTRFGDSLMRDVRFAIAETEDVPNLLGRLDVFDSLRIVFDPVNHETQVTPI